MKMRKSGHNFVFTHDFAADPRDQLNEGFRALDAVVTMLDDMIAAQRDQFEYVRPSHLRALLAPARDNVAQANEELMDYVPRGSKWAAPEEPADAAE